MCQIIQILSLIKSRAEDVPVIWTKNVYSFKSLSNAEELYFDYFNTLHQRWTLSIVIYGHEIYTTISTMMDYNVSSIEIDIMI